MLTFNRLRELCNMADKSGKNWETSLKIQCGAKITKTGKINPVFRRTKLAGQQDGPTLEDVAALVQDQLETHLAQSIPETHYAGGLIRTARKGTLDKAVLAQLILDAHSAETEDAPPVKSKASKRKSKASAADNGAADTSAAENRAAATLPV